jgi:hypothetical protein
MALYGSDKVVSPPLLMKYPIRARAVTIKEANNMTKRFANVSKHEDHGKGKIVACRRYPDHI